MSWLFGIKSPGSSPPQLPGLPPPPDGGDEKGGGDWSKTAKGDGYRFDSAALERAAKAAKELEQSRKFYG